MKKKLKAIAALLLSVVIVCMAGCNPEDDPNNGGSNGGGNNGSQDELPAGMYLGIIGFNDQLVTQGLARLDASTVASRKQFINGLSLGGATLLYHAVNTSIDMLANNKAPKDLVNVSIVTFTDGLDKGSYAMNPAYNSGAEYLKAVTQRIRHDKINNLPIEAHTIGIQGSDVYSYDQEEFLNNLEGLASTPKQEFVHYVDNFEDVQVVFDSIAAKLHKQTTNSKLTIKMPVEDPNTRVRFTLDVTTFDPNGATESTAYIEGVYVTGSDGNGVLTNVQYKGISSSSGTSVTSKTEGAFAKFQFEGMEDTNHEAFNNHTIAHLEEWVFNNNANAWIHNSEFTSTGNTEITNDYYSSMILLNLDCSQSLGNATFNQLKDYANRFVEGLKINN